MNVQFKMTIANIYSLSDGPSLTGRIESGIVQIGDDLQIVSSNGIYPVRVIGIEAFQKSLKIASSENGLVGISVSGIDAKSVKNRDVLRSV